MCFKLTLLMVFLGEWFGNKSCRYTADKINFVLIWCLRYNTNGNGNHALITRVFLKWEQKHDITIQKCSGGDGDILSFGM